MILLKLLFLVTTSVLLFSQTAFSQAIAVNGVGRPAPANGGDRTVPNPGRVAPPPAAIAKGGNSPNAGKSGFGQPEPGAGKIGTAPSAPNGGNPSNRLSPAKALPADVLKAVFGVGVVRQVTVKSVLDYSTYHISPLSGQIAFASEHSLIVSELAEDQQHYRKIYQYLDKEPRMSFAVVPSPLGPVGEALTDSQALLDYVPLPATSKVLRTVESDLVQARMSDLDPYTSRMTEFTHLGYTQMKNEELTKLITEAYADEFGFGGTDATELEKSAASSRAKATQAPSVRFVRAVKSKLFISEVVHEDWLSVNWELVKSADAAQFLGRVSTYSPVRQSLKYDPDTQLWDAKGFNVNNGEQIDYKQAFGETTPEEVNTRMNAIYNFDKQLRDSATDSAPCR